MDIAEKLIQLAVLFVLYYSISKYMDAVTAFSDSVADELCSLRKRVAMMEKERDQ